MGREAYAHMDSAVIAAADNPLDKRYSVVVIAGLSAASTYRAATKLMGMADRPAGEVLLLANGAKPRSLVLPAPELVRELEEK